MSRGRRMQAQGESTTETQAALRADRVAGWLRVPLIVAALLAIPTIIVQESELGGIWEILATVLDWCIWAMFAANLLIMLSIVPDRRRWLINNPLDVLIVVFTPPLLPATMKRARVLPVVRLVWLVVVANRLRNVFSLEGLRYAALIVFTVVVGGGVGFVALLTGALAQRFLYGGSGGAAPEPDPDKAEMKLKLDELSHQITELQKALRERPG